MARVGVDAHVLTGKHQGTRTWLRHMLLEIDRIAPPDDYVVYSSNPELVSGMVGASSLRHRQLPARPAPVRMLATWPVLAASDRLDTLVTQYNAPPWGAGRQVVVVHDVLFETHPQFFPPMMRRRLQVMTRLSVARASLVVTVSEYSRHQIEARYGVSPAKLVVCRNGTPPRAEPDEQSLSYAASLEPYLLMVGRLEPRKNVDLVLRATSGLRARGVHLVVVGSADFASEATVEALRCAEGVVHLQSVPDGLLAALYAAARALVFASSGEGFGLPVLEALSHGTPVIASDKTSIPEVGGDVAWYFDPDGPDAVSDLAALAAQAIQDPPTWDEEVLSSHLAQFDWRASAETFAAAIASLSQDGGRRA